MKAKITVVTMVFSVLVVAFLQVDFTKRRETLRDEKSLFERSTQPVGESSPQNHQVTSHPSPDWNPAQASSPQIEPSMVLMQHLENRNTEAFLVELEDQTPQSLDYHDSNASGRVLALSISLRKQVETRALIRKGFRLKEADALLEVLKERDTEYLQFLVELGLDANLSSLVHPNKPIHFAVRLGDPEMVRSILQMNAKVRVRDRAGRTPFEYAALAENILGLSDSMANYEKIENLLEGRF